ncbi:GNAT family N-acetyltransferase [Candidatus Halobonum tyrrellensis]|uniref:Acetyltransferase n=1 Tax=Candidatus Halobonum tyrrellensis G22 TaxID=1324957 RepID=V4J0Q2_9EURY|nr:GNAT family N-acetyltransferase [Candidatus Halobonum tyrrellensis]ESP89052.1 acetyltransferase [Candidatus Halobonum tyrrellensis G22]
MGSDDGHVVREAASDDELAVRRLLDGALLERPEDLPARIGAGDVLVSVNPSEREAEGTVTGALVLDGSRVAAVAVRRRRRGRGVGSALVRAAAARVDDHLTAEFRADVRPFYESLGFEIRRTDDDRLRGRLG